MITRRDFIKGLGAMAAALVIPKVEATPETGEATLDDRIDAAQPGDVIYCWPSDPCEVASVPKVEEPEELHVTFTEAEDVFRYTWNPETGEETLVTGGGVWRNDAYATDELIADSPFTTDELLEMASQPSVPLATRMDEDWAAFVTLDESGAVMCRAWYKVRGTNEILFLFGWAAPYYPADIEAVFYAMDKEAEGQARERLGLNDDERDYEGL